MHPVIELLIARMESTPEDFIAKGWEHTVRECEKYANDEEKAALKAATRILGLGYWHKQVMQQLLNPEPYAGETSSVPSPAQLGLFGSSVPGHLTAYGKLVP